MSSFLLALIVGLGGWLLVFGARAVRWVEGSSRDYVVGRDPTLEPRSDANLSLSHFGEALRALQRSVPGDYRAYAKTSLTGRRIELEDGASFPLFRELYVSATFFSARGVEVQRGRLWDEAEGGAAVIGYGLARRLFGAAQLAVGKRVRLYAPGAVTNTEEKVIVGVLGPSPSQDPELDADDALVLPLARRLEEEQGEPLYLFVRFEGASEAERVVPHMRAWSEAHFGPEGIAEPIDNLVQERGRFAEDALESLAARRITLVTFTVLLTLAMVTTLYTHLGWSYALERRRLGLERALGASRVGATLAFAKGQLLWSLIGGGAGGIGLWLLGPRLGARLGSLEPPLLLLAALVPSLTLLPLLVATLAPLMRQPVAVSLRPPRPRGCARLPIYLAYGGLSLALSGGIAATQVYLHLRGEASGLEARFSRLYTLQTGASVLDFRAERALEALQAVPAFGGEDVRALTSLPGVRRGSLAQTLPHLTVSSGGRQLSAWTVVADGAYMGLLGLSYGEGTGAPEGCAVSRRVADALRVGIGARLELSGRGV